MLINVGATGLQSQPYSVTLQKCSVLISKTIELRDLAMPPSSSGPKRTPEPDDEKSAKSKCVVVYIKCDRYWSIYRGIPTPVAVCREPRSDLMLARSKSRYSATWNFYKVGIIGQSHIVLNASFTHPIQLVISAGARVARELPVATARHHQRAQQHQRTDD